MSVQDRIRRAEATRDRLGATRLPVSLIGDARATEAQIQYAHDLVSNWVADMPVWLWDSIRETRASLHATPLPSLVEWHICAVELTALEWGAELLLNALRYSPLPTNAPPESPLWSVVLAYWPGIRVADPPLLGALWTEYYRASAVSRSWVFDPRAHTSDTTDPRGRARQHRKYEFYRRDAVASLLACVRAAGMDPDAIEAGLHFAASTHEIELAPMPPIRRGWPVAREALVLLRAERCAPAMDLRAHRNNPDKKPAAWLRGEIIGASDSGRVVEVRTRSAPSLVYFAREIATVCLLEVQSVPLSSPPPDTDDAASDDAATSAAAVDWPKLDEAVLAIVAGIRQRSKSRLKPISAATILRMLPPGLLSVPAPERESYMLASLRRLAQAGKLVSLAGDVESGVLPAELAEDEAEPTASVTEASVPATVPETVAPPTAAARGLPDEPDEPPPAPSSEADLDDEFDARLLDAVRRIHARYLSPAAHVFVGETWLGRRLLPELPEQERQKVIAARILDLHGRGLLRATIELNPETRQAELVVLAPMGRAALA